MANTVAQMVATAKAEIENLTVEQAFDEHRNGSALFVDLREPAELEAGGTIPESHHAPRGMLEFYADPASPYHRDVFDPNRRVVLFCASGGRSAMAAARLGELGYRDVAHLDGGFKAWTEAGLPVSEGPS